MSKITVTTIAGLTSGGDANKVKIESGDTLEVVSNATVGGTLGVTGAITGTTQTLNRSGDGDLIAFQKDGTTVGSIGSLVSGRDLHVNSSGGILTLESNFNSTERQVVLGDTYFGLVSNDDNAVDLGRSSARYKDLYLGGGLYVGGTGAANKLDDYEEGTWVPVVKDTSGGSAYTYASHYEFRLPGLTSSTNALPYTKIGNRVFITFSIWWNTTANTRYNISLPFAYDGSAYGLCGSATPYNISTDSGLGILGTISNVANFDTYAVTSSGGHGTVPYSSSSEVYYFINYVVA